MITKEALDLIKSSEGLRLKAYQDPVGVWTIGYGHTSAAGAPKVVRGMTITGKEAEAILKKDLETIYVPAVKRNVKVKLNENQLGALVSFTYNLGETNLKGSTLLRKLNAGDYKGASAEFGKWVNADGRRLPGLVKRRALERKLFDTPVVASNTNPSSRSFLQTLFEFFFGKER